MIDVVSQWGRSSWSVESLSGGEVWTRVQTPRTEIDSTWMMESHDAHDAPEVATVVAEGSSSSIIIPESSNLALRRSGNSELSGVLFGAPSEGGELCGWLFGGSLMRGEAVDKWVWAILLSSGGSARVSFGWTVVAKTFLEVRTLRAAGRGPARRRACVDLR